MALKFNFPQDIIKGRSKKALADIRAAIIERLVHLGEEGVNYARSQERIGFWNDVTGNLRSSVGYVIYELGQNVVTSGFEGAGAEGPGKGRMLADTIAMNYANSWFCLVLVAGMNYAVNVESKGKDVLTGATRILEKKFPESLKQMTENLRSNTYKQ